MTGREILVLIDAPAIGSQNTGHDAEAKLAVSQSISLALDLLSTRSTRLREHFATKLVSRLRDLEIEVHALAHVGAGFSAAISSSEPVSGEKL